MKNKKIDLDKVSGGGSMDSIVASAKTAIASPDAETAKTNIEDLNSKINSKKDQDALRRSSGASFSIAGGGI